MQAQNFLQNYHYTQCICAFYRGKSGLLKILRPIGGGTPTALPLNPPLRVAYLCAGDEMAANLEAVEFNARDASNCRSRLAVWKAEPR